jgi:hypothetical protein
MEVIYMTTKSELDDILKACEECAGSDDKSYHEHFEECPTCKEYAEKAEKLNQQIEVLELMAAKPLEARKQILGARMRKFLSMQAPERKAAITELLDGLHELDDDALSKVVKARTDLMMEIPKEHRETLMVVLGDIMTKWPEDRKMRERKAVIKATEDYFFLKRKMVRKKFGKMMQ